MQQFKILALSLALLIVAGCFPIELDVSADGTIVIARSEGFFTYQPKTGKTNKLLGPDLGKPVFARFSPDGKELLAVVEAPQGFQEFAFHVVPIAGGKPRKIFQGEKTAYVRYSPDGSHLAISLIPSMEDPVFKTQIPEVKLVNVKDGKVKSLSKKVAVLTRWFPDSKRLLTFNIVSKIKDDSYSGTISAIDVASGKATPICAAAADKSLHFDLSPDGKTIVFTGFAAGKVGTDLTKSETYTKKLFQVTVATGEVLATDKSAEFAIFSPDGKHLALGTEPEGFSLDRVKLEIAKAGKYDETTIVAPESYKGLALGGGGGMFPGWINNDTLFYFDQRAVYGTEAKSVNMVVVDMQGNKRKNVQPAIDLAATTEE